VNPRTLAMLFDPGRARAPGHYGARAVAFRSLESVGSPMTHLSGLYHTAFVTRCLRFAARVAPRPRKTRFQLVASLGWTGLTTCRVHSGKFRDNVGLRHRSSFPRLSLARQAA